MFPSQKFEKQHCVIQTKYVTATTVVVFSDVQVPEFPSAKVCV